MMNNFSPVRSGSHSRPCGYPWTHRAGGLLALLLAGLPLTGRAQTTFSNATSIAIPRNTVTQGPADLYPSPVTVAGLGNNLTNLTVTFTGLGHAYMDDIDVLLVGPTGQNVLLMSDTGGYFPAANLTLTFSDAATASLPDEAQIVSGTYKPTNYDGPYAPYTPDSFAAPAPLTGPYGATLSLFNGTNPNGMWSLYVLDDEQGNSGAMTGGWSMTVTAVPEPSSLALGAGALALLGGVAVRRRRTAARA